MKKQYAGVDTEVRNIHPCFSYVIYFHLLQKWLNGSSPFSHPYSRLMVICSTTWNLISQLVPSPTGYYSLLKALSREISLHFGSSFLVDELSVQIFFFTACLGGWDDCRKGLCWLLQSPKIGGPRKVFEIRVFSKIGDEIGILSRYWSTIVYQTKLTLTSLL